jgi:hypothetical protein
MTEQYKYGHEINVAHMALAPVSEDGVVISIDIPEGGAEEEGSFIARFLPSFSDAKVARLRHSGSRTVKVALRRARKVQDKGGSGFPAHGQLASSLVEQEIIRSRMPKRLRKQIAENAKKPRPQIQQWLYINPEGVKKDIRDMDYLTLLNMAHSDVKQEFGRIPRAKDDDKA